jgi:catechol 2,3-dioxygenase-like lactoylglutathione lyase family enzyme
VSAAAPIGHVGLTVPDVEAAARWYADVLGWQVLMGPVDVTVADARVADQIRDVFAREDVAFRQVHMLAGNGVAVELFEFRAPPTEARATFDYTRVGVFHVCVVDPQIERLAERIEAAGGRRRTAIRPIFPGEPYRFCYCEDPWGNALEIATHPHDESFGGRRAY